VHPGDTLISTVRTYLRAIAFIGSGSQVWQNNMVASTGFAVLSPKRTDLPEYIVTAIQAHDFIDAVTRESKGVNYPAITSVELGNIPIRVFADLNKQFEIVQFLKHKMSEIDRFIANKKRLIELFEEQKRAIVSRAVTRGIREDVPMKPSGLNWLGEIPAHWENKRAKHYFREIDDRSADGSEELLSVSHLTGVTPRREKNITMFLAESYEGSKLCEPGDLVINIMWAWMGACGVSATKGIVSPAYGVYRPYRSDIFHPSFLDLLVRAAPYVAEYTIRSTGITSSRLRMYSDAFFDLRIFRPPLHEQEEIVCVVEKNCHVIDSAIKIARREIELIEEFRTTLISEVVTGKRDIRPQAGALGSAT